MRQGGLQRTKSLFSIWKQNLRHLVSANNLVPIDFLLFGRGTFDGPGFDQLGLTSRNRAFKPGVEVLAIERPDHTISP
jgi:hypothetical protein